MKKFYVGCIFETSRPMVMLVVEQSAETSKGERDPPSGRVREDT